MHVIVCRSTEGLLRTGNLDSRLREGQGARDCDRGMHMFSQDPRESRSKARTGAHNHGTAGTDPADRRPRLHCLGFVFNPKKRKLKYCGESVSISPSGARVLAIRRATLAIELGGRSNLPNWTFPISWRFVPSLFCYASAFHFHLAAPGCYASD
jgi:hypothetical protein